MKLQDQKINLMFVGPYPPPFGGISSLILSLIEGYDENQISKAVVVYFDKEDSVEYLERATIYRFSIKKNLAKVFNPKNIFIIFKSLSVYRGKNLSLRDYIVTIIKTILIDTIACKEDINVVSFYQSDFSLSLLLCKKLWNKRIIKKSLELFGAFFYLISLQSVTLNHFGIQ